MVLSQEEMRKCVCSFPDLPQTVEPSAGHWISSSPLGMRDRSWESLCGIQMLSVQPDTKPKGCAGCNRKIKDRYLLKALDKYWHEDCLKCACCDCRLGEVGSTLYTKANLILCRRDYLRLFGVTGNCAACSKLIPAFEMVMRAKDNVYHLDCFACQLCNQRFCVGDKFFLKNNMILCQTDYEEGLMKEGYAPQVR
uniref:LIM domain only protein 3 n=3 Tax=Passeriformes TaxID=9126 RepID=A0A8D2QBE9_ZONAL